MLKNATYKRKDTSTGSCELEQPAFAVTNRAMPLAATVMVGGLAETRSGLWTRLTENLSGRA